MLGSGGFWIGSGGGGGVTSLNSLTGSVTLAAGTNITLTPSGNTIIIASTSSGSITGSGTANAVTYWNGSSSITADSAYFNYSSPVIGFGVGLTYAEIAAAGHFRGAYAQTVAPVASATATLVNFPLPGTVSGATATQSPGHMYAASTPLASKAGPSVGAPTSTSATINYGSGGYTATGNTINYVIYGSKSGTYAIDFAPSFGVGPDNSSSDPYFVSISWSAPSTGINSPDNYRIYRNFNGAGFTEYQDVGNTTSFNDQNSGWNSGSQPPTPQFNDYIASGNQSYIYQIWQGASDGMGGFIWAKVSTTASTGSVGTGGDAFTVNVSWSANPTGTVTPTIYRIYRDNAGSGFTAFRDTTSTSFNDNNTGWTGGAPPPTPQFPDYIATGTTRLYHAYNQSVTPSIVFSATAQDYQFTDDNSGNPYVVLHSGYNFPVYTTDYFLGDSSGLGTGGHFSTTASSFIEDPTTWTAGASTTPTTYGYLSDGTTLNRDYKFYQEGTISGSTVYSADMDASVTDPNDGNYYYVSLGFTGDGDVVKTLRQINGGGYNAAKETTVGFNDDGIITFLATLIVTPTSVYGPAGLFEGPYDATTPSSNLVLRATSPSSEAGRIDFVNSGNVALFKMGAQATSFYLFATDQTGSFTLGSGAINLGADKVVFQKNLVQNNLPVFSGFNVGFQAQSSSTITQIIVGASSQSANLLNFADSTGSYTNYASFDKTSVLTLAKGSTSQVGLIMPNASALKTSAVVGGMEFLTDKFYGTISTGTARKEVTLNDIALTSGRVAFSTTNGRLTDDADMTFAVDTLTVTKIAATTFTGNITLSTKNIVTDTTTGTIIGTATTQKLGFFNKTPAVQQTGGAATATALYTATEQGMLQKAYDCLRTFGFLS